MAEAVNENGSLLYGFGVILNYLFRVDKLMEIVKTNLPMHIVEKKDVYKRQVYGGYYTTK